MADEHGYSKFYWRPPAGTVFEFLARGWQVFAFEDLIRPWDPVLPVEAARRLLPESRIERLNRAILRSVEMYREEARIEFRSAAGMRETAPLSTEAEKLIAEFAELRRRATKPIAVEKPRARRRHQTKYDDAGLDRRPYQDILVATSELLRFACDHHGAFDRRGTFGPLGAVGRYGAFNQQGSSDKWAAIWLNIDIEDSDAGLTDEHVRRGKNAFYDRFAEASHLVPPEALKDHVNCAIRMNVRRLVTLLAIRAEALAHPEFSKLKGAALFHALEARIDFTGAVSAAERALFPEIAA